MMTVRTTFTRFGAHLACAGLAATVVVGFAATSANAETGGVKLALVQSVSFVADSHGDLLFASGPTRPGVLVTDGTGNTITQISTPGIADLALAPDGSAVYAAATSSSQILKIDPVSLNVTATYQLPAAQCPTSVAVVGGYLAFGYTCDGQWGGVGVLDLAQPTAPPKTVSSGAVYNPLVRAVPGHSEVLEADQGLSPASFKVISIANGLPTETASTYLLNCNNLTDVALSPNGSTFTPACGAPYNFVTYSLTTFAQVGVFGANPYPNAAAYSADGKYFAGGMNGIYTNDVVEYQLSSAQPTLLYAIDETSATDASLNGASRGVAFSADGSTLYEVTQDTQSGNVVLHTLPVSGAVATSVTIVPPANVSNVGSPMTIGGKLSFADGSTTGTRTLSLSRSQGGVTTMLAPVTTADNGTYGFTDTPVSTGTVSYTVTFGGDPTHLSSSASQGVQIRLNATSLTISATRLAGTHVTVTAHLGTTYTNRTVTIAANGKTIASGTVNSAGDLTTIIKAKSGTTFVATFSGDAWYAPASASVTL
jgi:hypothetical protein